jgi:hypothetical protein
MRKSSVLTVRASIWARRLSIGRGRSYRTFVCLSECRQYAQDKGYSGIRVKFC